MMTRALHSGWSYDPTTGASGLPIYLTSAYRFRDSEHAARLFALEEDGFVYSRLANPTVAAFEEGLNSLDGGVGCVATSSGHSALVHLITALCSSGDELIVSKKVYGGTLTVLKSVFARFGIKTVFVDTDHPCQVDQAMTDETRGIITETIGNPMMNVAPLESIGRVARRNKVPFIVDNTFATPALCRPLEWGANVVTYSTTKYISGAGNVMGGAIIDGGNMDWDPEMFPGLAKPDPFYHGIVFSEKFGKAALYGKLRASIIRDMGGCPSAFDSYLLHLSLATLPLRMERHSENALEVARFLESHPDIEWVSYPGLESHPQHDMAEVYLKDGCSGMMAFSIKGGVEAGRRFIDSLKLIGHMANVGDSRTLVVHPASTTHSQLTAEERSGAGITDGLIRLSVGIEDVEDIIDELKMGLEAARNGR
jgi:O-acetylhomoserine (thiol)-lyase